MVVNSKFVAPIVFGCILNGSIFYPMMNRQSAFDADGIEFHLAMFKPKVLVVEQFAENVPDILDIIQKIQLKCKLFILLDHSANNDIREISDADAQQCRKQLRSSSLNNDHIVAMIETSGSTGIAKIYPMNGHYFNSMEYIYVVKLLLLNIFIDRCQLLINLF